MGLSAVKASQNNFCVKYESAVDYRFLKKFLSCLQGPRRSHKLRDPEALLPSGRLRWFQHLIIHCGFFAFKILTKKPGAAKLSLTLPNLLTLPSIWILVRSLKEKYFDAKQSALMQFSDINRIADPFIYSGHNVSGILQIEGFALFSDLTLFQ